METQRLTLHELAQKSGIELRTIRNYVSHGIIPGPDTLGRAARYPPEALARLKLFTLLRDAHRGLGLDAIRRLIDGLTPATIDDVAEGRQSLTEVIPPSLVEKTPSTGGAVAYLQSLGQAPHGRAAGGGAPHGAHGHAHHPPHSGHTKAGAGGLADIDLPRLAHAAQALADLVGFTSARSSRGTTWYRIPLTRDIELSVRGDVAPEQIAHIHRIADSLRLLLTKGSKS